MEGVEVTSYHSAFVSMVMDGTIFFLKCLELSGLESGLLSCWTAHFLDTWMEHNFVVVAFFLCYFFGLHPMACLGC